MGLLKLINEVVETDDYLYRVYKKSRTEYRVEEKRDSGWEEILSDMGIEQILLIDCRTVVDERGRQDTLENTGQDSSDVAVHAWIECNDFKIDETLSSTDGTLYYNPYTVSQFVDRDSFENGNPDVIEEAEFISTDGNELVYQNALKTRRDRTVMDDNMDLIRQIQETLSQNILFKYQQLNIY